MGIRVLIDGAHALGQITLDLSDIRGMKHAEDGAICFSPDYFVANCHKWLSSARGAAILVVRPDRQGEMRPPVTSWGQGQGFSSAFAWDGCRDYAPYLATQTAIALQRAFTPARVESHMSSMLREAVDLLCRAWASTPFVSPNLWPPGMALVQAPCGGPLPSAGKGEPADAKWLQGTNTACWDSAVAFAPNITSPRYCHAHLD